MRVLVTGATGFVGGAVARRLARDGHDVRALARPGSNSSRLAASGVEIVDGDVRDRASLALAMRGCSHVIHLAAAKGFDSTLLRDVNVGGTANALDSARVEGVQRFVFGSTMGVYGFVTGDRLDERSPIRPNTPYRRSKWQAEQVVREAHERTAAPSVVARLSSVVGPGALGWVPLARNVAAGRARLIGGGTNAIDLVAVDDIADALVRCATVPDIEGKSYVLGAGEELTFAAFAETIASALGAPLPRRGPSAVPFVVAQRLASFVFRASGLALPRVHTRETLVADKRSSSDLARAELGYDPSTPVELAVRAMVDRYVAEGLVKRVATT